jgi:hypothetical protein
MAAGCLPPCLIRCESGSDRFHRSEGAVRAFDPGLAPWAWISRPFGAESIVGGPVKFVSRTYDSGYYVAAARCARYPVSGGDSCFAVMLCVARSTMERFSTAPSNGSTTAVSSTISKLNTSSGFRPTTAIPTLELTIAPSAAARFPLPFGPPRKRSSAQGRVNNSNALMLIPPCGGSIPAFTIKQIRGFFVVPMKCIGTPQNDRWRAQHNPLEFFTPPKPHIATLMSFPSTFTS